DVGLPGILDAEQIVVRAAIVLRASLRVGIEQDFTPAKKVHREWIGHVAIELKMLESIETCGPAGMPRDQDQIAVARAAGTESQVIAHPRRLIVLVRAEQTDVEVVPRVFEIVGIAAEERDRQLWSEHQTDIGVTLVAVEVKLRALVQRDHVAAQSA